MILAGNEPGGFYLEGRFAEGASAYEARSADSAADERASVLPQLGEVHRRAGRLERADDGLQAAASLAGKTCPCWSAPCMIWPW